ncbi:MAG: capsid cement protein [Smithella sp.]
MQNDGIRTFTAKGAITNKARLKVVAGSTTVPIEVEIAGAGEQHIGIAEYAVADKELVAVKLRTYPGTHEGVASEAFAVGATLYAAASGKIKDTSDGTAIGIALEEATANGDIVEFIDFTVISTTAATVSAAAGGLSIPATVQAALAELYQGLVKTVQGFIPIPLTSFRELAAGVFINAAGNGGILASDTTPILTNIADGDAMRIAWAAGNTDQIAASVVLPPDLDGTADLVVHMLCSKDANANNAVHMDGEAYFGESDVDCFPAAAAANLLVQNKGEYTATILAADVADTQADANMTLLLMPEAHAADVVYLHAAWIEYKKKLLTA